MLSYSSLEESLVSTTSPHGPPGVPDMLEDEAGQRGDGIDVHLALSAVLDFEEANGRWPALNSEEDAASVVSLTSAVSGRNKEKEGAVWLQKIEWGFPSGEDRPADAKRVGRFAKLFGTELTGFCAYLGGAVAQVAICIKIDEFCIKNDELCI